MLYPLFRRSRHIYHGAFHQGRSVPLSRGSHSSLGIFDALLKPRKFSSILQLQQRSLQQGISDRRTQQSRHLGSISWPVCLQKRHVSTNQQYENPNASLCKTRHRFYSSMGSFAPGDYGTTSHRMPSKDIPTENDNNPKDFPQEESEEHILNFCCERLTRDIDIFMQRREQAVVRRRKERLALLDVLQQVVKGIWSNPECHIEIYGSCATLVDLPSSDLDLIVLGLEDDNSLNEGNDDDDAAEDHSSDETEETTTATSHTPRVSSGDSSPPAYLQTPAHRANAARVEELSEILKALPWAVEIKPVPTAPVPVIKILANLSKIQEAAAEGPAVPDMDKEQLSYYDRFPKWRGSDLKDGLLSVDITFKGPGHGGLGSHEYSKQVLQHMCQISNQKNLNETPFVKCLMVLKEMLAIRKLSVSYWGGVSGYALLLLLTALLRERNAIQQEMLHPSPPKPAPKVPAVPAPTSRDAAMISENQQKAMVTDPSPQVPGDDCPRQFDLEHKRLVEALCTGETTSGKLLLHFLLHYGLLFDGRFTAIDISGTHKGRFDPATTSEQYHELSPFIQRSAATLDPITGTFVLEKLVLYDPREGAHHKNIGRWCYNWPDIQWTFARSYERLMEGAAAQCRGGSTVVQEPHATMEPPKLGDPSFRLLSLLILF